MGGSSNPPAVLIVVSFMTTKSPKRKTKHKSKTQSPKIGIEPATANAPSPPSYQVTNIGHVSVIVESAQIVQQLERTHQSLGGCGRKKRNKEEQEKNAQEEVKTTERITGEKRTAV